MDIHMALPLMFKGQKYTLRGDTLDGLEWDSSNTMAKPTQEEVDAWILANGVKEEAKLELAELDSIIPRWAEDLLAGSNQQVFGKTAETVTRKNVLRAVL